MSENHDPGLAPAKENWGSRFGVILAVAGSAVGLGNFLRFPGTAVNNGGGAFMIPYIISFLILGIPIAWCEWTIGRLGGHMGQNNGPGIMYGLWRRSPAKVVGTLTLVIPVAVYMYYVLLEAMCLRFAVEFFCGGFAETFNTAVKEVSNGSTTQAVVDASTSFALETFGESENGALFSTSMLWYVLGCFLINFVIIYSGVTRGIERFCKIAMPLLIACAIVILIRVLTLSEVVDGRTIESGLGFMWNPDWMKLKDPEVWLRAAGQIFFSLSVGFGLILCYSSYLRRNDDVVLSSLSASSTNEFCEVALGGLIVVPAAFLFLGPGNTPDSTLALGYFTMPAIMHFMPGGSFFGGMWFGLLFIAAVTSSISMLQPAVAFLEDGFGVRRRSSVVMIGLFTMGGAGLVMYFSKGIAALDFTDFWCEFMMILAALGQVIIFGWVIGAEKGVDEANRGAEMQIPPFVAKLIRYVTPTFLIVVLAMWCFYNGPDRIRGMSPSVMGSAAARAQYAGVIAERPEYADLEEETLDGVVTQVLGTAVGVPKSTDSLPQWLQEVAPQAQEAKEKASSTANVARFVFLGVLLTFIFILVLADIACRGRIKCMLDQSEDMGEACS